MLKVIQKSMPNKNYYDIKLSNGKNIILARKPTRKYTNYGQKVMKVTKISKNTAFKKIFIKKNW